MMRCHGGTCLTPSECSCDCVACVFARKAFADRPKRRFFARVRLQPVPRFADMWVDAVDEAAAVAEFKRRALLDAAASSSRLCNDLVPRQGDPDVEVVYMNEVRP